MTTSNTAALASFLMAGSDGYSALTTAGAQRQQGQMAYEAAEFNSRIAERQAADAITRGDRTAALVARRGSALRGAQRVSYAGQNVDVADGSALLAQQDTEAMTEQDVLQVKSNAWREAWGLKTEAELGRQRGRFDKMAGDNAANATALTGGLRFASGALRGYSDWKGGQGSKPGEYYAGKQQDAAWRSRSKR